MWVTLALLGGVFVAAELLRPKAKGGYVYPCGTCLANFKGDTCTHPVEMYHVKETQLGYVPKGGHRAGTLYEADRKMAAEENPNNHETWNQDN